MRPYVNDTIAAIATPVGRGGIGVVRVSGPGVIDLMPAICGRSLVPREASVCGFRDAAGAVIDRGVAIYFAAPKSFTGEQVLELQGHGGQAVLQAVLARCLALGARLARPGEFTERAFLNDRLDLAQAEAVADLIDATSVAAARSAMRSLDGEFSIQVRALVDALIELRMLIEATLDFPEEEIDILRDTDAASRLTAWRRALAHLRARAQQGRVLRQGIHVVLMGVPNVGKSSLLNQLAGEDRAIVTDIAGTTRDAIKESIHIDGVPVHVTDTAGLRESVDPVEQIGIARTWAEISRADVVLQLVDVRHGVSVDDQTLATRLPKTAERLIVENKIDITGQAPGRFAIDGVWHIRLSAKRGDGMALLRDELLRIVGWSGGEDVVLARERHLEALAMADQSAADAERELARSELCAESLRRAQMALATITGEFTPDDLLGEIFSRFCIGK